MLGIDDAYHLARRMTNAAGEKVWVYFCSHGKWLQPIGYCSERCGHTSPAEAQQHYLEYLLDEATYDGRWIGVSYRCEICGKWTDRFAQLKSAFTMYRLCENHLNRHALSNLLFGLTEQKQLRAAALEDSCVKKIALA